MPPDGGDRAQPELPCPWVLANSGLIKFIFNNEWLQSG